MQLNKNCNYNCNTDCNMIEMITMGVDYGKIDFALFLSYLRDKKYIQGAKWSLQRPVFNKILFASRNHFLNSICQALASKNVYLKPYS